MNTLENLPEQYCPKGVSEVVWDPQTLRVYASALRSQGHGTIEVNPGLLLFLLDCWEDFKDNRTFVTTGGDIVKGYTI
jgi:hypothetical protein